MTFRNLFDNLKKTCFNFYIEVTTMFLYILNYPPEQKEMCALEMKCLFGFSHPFVICSDKDYPAGRSAFFKTKIDVICLDHDQLFFLEKVKEVTIDLFKVNYIKTNEDPFMYQERMDLVRSVARSLNGIGSIEKTATQLAVTYFENTYYLGYMHEDHQSWQLHLQKPQSYSQSLSSKDARSLVNMATCGNDVSIIDPCCGVGTVVLEALSMHHRMDACEIHPGVTWKANRNLEYFGYPKIVCNRDMHTIEKKYDVAILDIPYNLYSSITKEEQGRLIGSCFKMARRFVLLSYEDLSDLLVKNHWQIIDQCVVKKMKLERIIYICERRTS